MLGIYNWIRFSKSRVACYLSILILVMASGGCSKVESVMLEHSHASKCTPICNQDSGQLQPCECSLAECQDNCHELHLNRPNAKAECLKTCETCDAVRKFSTVIEETRQTLVIGRFLIASGAIHLFECHASCGFMTEESLNSYRAKGIIPECVRPSGRPAEQRPIFEDLDLRVVIESGRYTPGTWHGRDTLVLDVALSGSSTKDFLAHEGFAPDYRSPAKPNRLLFHVEGPSGGGFPVKQYERLPEVPGKEAGYRLTIPGLTPQYSPVKILLYLPIAPDIGYGFATSESFSATNLSD